MTAWQCGGQGFESPQLHPDDQAVLLQEGGLSRSWCHRVGHWSAVEEGAEAGDGVLTAVGKDLGSEVDPDGRRLVGWAGGHRSARRSALGVGGPGRSAAAS